MSETVFTCALCWVKIPLDRFDGDEFLWWSACVDHYQSEHPESRYAGVKI